MTADPVTADVAAPRRAVAAADHASGELPCGWAWTTLGEVTTFVRNGLPQRPDSAPPGHRILRINAVRPLKVDLDEVRYLNLPESAVAGYFVHDWDLLFTRYNGSLELLGVAGMVRNCTKPTLHPDKLIRVLTALDGQLAPYLELACNFGVSRAYIESKARTTAGQTGISGADLKQMPIPLTPLAEQRRIVAAIEQQFTRLDAGVAALRRAQTALKRYRAAVLKAAVEGRLTDDWRRANPDAEPAKTARERLYAARDFELRVVRSSRHLWGAGHVAAVPDAQRDSLPLTWDMCKVRDLGPDPTSVVQVGPMSMKSSEFSDTGVPVLNVGCVKWGRFDLSRLNHLPQEFARKFDRYRIRAGDVVFTRSGSVGRCAVAGPEQDGWLMTFHLLRARADTRVCLPTYLTFVFEGAPHIRKQIEAAAIGSTRAGFNTRLLEELDVPLPPLAEQQAIVPEVERQLSVVAELEAAVAANLARAERLRQAILREAFAGRLVPHDPDDEPASALLERIRRGRNTDGRDAVDGREKSRGDGGDMHETRALGSVEAVATKPIQERLW